MSVTSPRVMHANIASFKQFETFAIVIVPKIGDWETPLALYERQDHLNYKRNELILSLACSKYIYLTRLVWL